MTTAKEVFFWARVIVISAAAGVLLWTFPELVLVVVLVGVQCAKRL